MDIENLELQELTTEDLNTILNKEESLGSYENMKLGQELHIPVASDGQGNYVFFGPLDFSGKTNSLNDSEWKEFVEQTTSFKPEYRTVLKKSNDPDNIWIFAQASQSIGPCDSIAVCLTLLDLIQMLIEFKMDIIMQDPVLLRLAKGIVLEQDLDQALNVVADLEQHSFFTGVVYGPFKYVSGPKPAVYGFADVEQQKGI